MGVGDQWDPGIGGRWLGERKQHLQALWTIAHQSARWWAFSVLCHIDVVIYFALVRRCWEPMLGKCICLNLRISSCCIRWFAFSLQRQNLFLHRRARNGPKEDFLKVGQLPSDQGVLSARRSLHGPARWKDVAEAVGDPFGREAGESGRLIATARTAWADR